MALDSKLRILQNRKRIAACKPALPHSLGASIPNNSSAIGSIDGTWDTGEQGLMTQTCFFEEEVAFALASFGILDPAELG